MKEVPENVKNIINSLNGAEKDDVLSIIKKMSSREISYLVYDLEYAGWYRENRRQTRSFCYGVVENNWNYDSTRIKNAVKSALLTDYLSA